MAFPLRFGDSVLLGSGISACAPVNGCAPVLRSGHRTAEPVGLAGVPCFESRATRRNGSRKKWVPVILQAAAEPRSVGSPQPASTSESNGSQTPTPSHLDMLQRLTENSSASQGATIRDQLSSQVAEAGAVVSLASRQSERERTREPDKAAGVAAARPEGLTISQRRNIRRQNYLNKVSERNDAPFFAAVAAIILVPPLLILAAAVATGYVQLFP